MTTNEFNNNRDKGNSIKYSPINYEGHKIQPGRGKINELRRKIGATKVPASTKHHTDKEPTEPSSKDKEASILRKLVDSPEMEIGEFSEIAKLSIEKAKELKKRIQAAKKVVMAKKDPIISVSNVRLLKNLIGKEVIDAEAIECLNRLANYSKLDTALNNNAKDLNGTKSAIDELYSPENMDENFPDFGIDLLLVLGYLIPKFVTLNTFSYMCKIHTMIFSYVDKASLGFRTAIITTITTITNTINKVITGVNKVPGVSIPKLPTINPDIYELLTFVKPFQVLFTISANCINESIYWNTAAIVKHKVLQELMGGRGACVGSYLAFVPGWIPGPSPEEFTKNLSERTIDSKFPMPNPLPWDDVCNGAKYNLEEQAMLMFYGINPALSPSSDNDPQAIGPKRCQEDYIPTSSESTVARMLLEEGIRAELKAENASKIEANTKTPFNTLTSYTLLDKMENNTTTFIYRADGITEKLYTEDGNRVVDKVDASILGFFAIMNGSLQRIDDSVTKILSLEFITPQAKQWICCIIRFMYLIIPRVKHETKYKDMNFAFNTNDIEEISLDNQAWMEDVRLWVKILDTFLGVLAGSTSANIEINGLMSVGDVFNNSLKMAIAEAGSIIMTSLYHKLKENMFAIFKELKKLPDIKAAIEVCEPFDWMMNISLCGLENFFAKIQGIFAQMWAESSNSMKDVDMLVSISATNSTINLFRNLLKMIMDWEQSLINFCSLKTLATEAEKEQLLAKIQHSIDDKYPDPEANENMKDTGEIYTDRIPLGPEQVDATNSITSNEHTANAGPLYTGSYTTLKNVYQDRPDNSSTYANIPQTLSTEPITALPQNEPWTPSMAVMSCGDEYKAILSDRITNIEEIHKTVSEDSSKVKTENDIQEEEIGETLFPEDEETIANTEEEKIDEINSELNKPV